MPETSAPRKLFLLQLSTTQLPFAGRTLQLVLGCYLVELTDGRHVLIDTGYPPDVPRPPNSPPSQDELTVIERLAELNVRPDDIDVLICTHFDVDHVGYHELFTQAELIVQRSHYELARGGAPRFASARAHWDHPSLRYRMVDGDVEILPGITLLLTSGHTLGHQSVLVRLPNTGPVLLTIDAAMFQSLFSAERPRTPADEDVEQLRASVRKMLALVETEQVKLVVFGHDGVQWQSLRTSPDFYD